MNIKVLTKLADINIINKSIFLLRIQSWRAVTCIGSAAGHQLSGVG
jgi:hypothetical protein